MATTAKYKIDVLSVDQRFKMAMSANIEHATSKTRLKNDKNHIYRNYESY
jgi:hypothetical protein